MVAVVAVPAFAQAPIYPIPAQTNFPAKLQVFRAGIANGNLDILASLTGRASGKVTVTFVSNGTTTKFDVDIDPDTRNLKISEDLSRKAASLKTGIITITYNGDDNTYPDTVRVRAGSVKANLDRDVAKLDKAGNLTVAGTISKKARGVVRVRLDHPFASTSPVSSLFYNAEIKNGKWSISEKLPAAAAASGGELSIQFTGFQKANMRGEQDAKRVLPG